MSCIKSYPSLRALLAPLAVISLMLLGFIWVVHRSDYPASDKQLMMWTLGIGEVVLYIGLPVWAVIYDRRAKS